MLVQLLSRVRGILGVNYPEDADKPLTINTRGDLSVAQGMPPLAEIVRMGNSWVCGSLNGGAGVAPLTAEPTTVAGFTLFNGESATGKTYIIDSVAAYERVADATQENYTAIFGMLNHRNSAAPSGGTTLASNIASLNGRPNYTGLGVVRVGATVVNDTWVAMGNQAPFAAAIAGDIWKTMEIPLNGLFVVTPGSAFSVQATKVAATAAQMVYNIRWHEVQLPVV